MTGVQTCALPIFISTRRFEDSLEKFIRDYLNTKLGNPEHGDITIDRLPIEYVGLQEWTKKVLNKEIKKKLKALPDGHKITKIKFDVDPYSPAQNTIGLYSSNYISDLKKQAQELLSNMGYNNRILRIS